VGVQNTINFQGWGLVNLTNTIQQGLTAQPPAPSTAAKYYFDQDPQSALATGDSRTYTVKVNPTAAIAAADHAGLDRSARQSHRQPQAGSTTWT